MAEHALVTSVDEVGSVPDLATFSFTIGSDLSPHAYQDASPLLGLRTGIPRPEVRVVALKEGILNEESGVEVLKVSPHASPTIKDVIDQLELHPLRKAPTAFHWIIADTKNSTEEVLNHLSIHLVGTDFSEITVASDVGRKKTAWLNNILNCHVSRFEIDPEDPLRVKRTAVEVILAPNGLLTIDQNGDRDHLLKLRNEIAEGRAVPETSSSIGALAAKVIQEQLEHNELVLDKLEEGVDELSKMTYHGPLTYKQAHHMLPTLEEALAYFLRKVEQTKEVVTAIEHSERINPHFFGAPGQKECLAGVKETIQKLVRHTETVLEKVNRVEDRHDRQMQARGDKNIERFTFLIGLTAPPIIADIACKMLLPELHEWHAPLAVASMVAGVGLVAIAVMPEWIRNSRILTTLRPWAIQKYLGMKRLLAGW